MLVFRAAVAVSILSVSVNGFVVPQSGVGVRAGVGRDVLGGVDRRKKVGVEALHMSSSVGAEEFLGVSANATTTFPPPSTSTRTDTTTTTLVANEEEEDASVETTSQSFTPFQQTIRALPFVTAAAYWYDPQPLDDLVANIWSVVLDWDVAHYALFEAEVAVFGFFSWIVMWSCMHLILGEERTKASRFDGELPHKPFEWALPENYHLWFNPVAAYLGSIWVWLQIHEKPPLPEIPPTFGVLCVETLFGIWLYDLCFMPIHYVMHNWKLGRVRRVHGYHHRKGETLNALETVQHSYIDGFLQVFVNIMVQKVTPFGGAKHVFSRLLHNLSVTYLLTEAHSGYRDLPWMTHRIFPEILGGAPRHEAHHHNGKVYYQQYFKYIDDFFGFTEDKGKKNEHETIQRGLKLRKQQQREQEQKQEEEKNESPFVVEPTAANELENPRGSALYAHSPSRSAFNKNWDIHTAKTNHNPISIGNSNSIMPTSSSSSSRSYYGRRPSYRRPRHTRLHSTSTDVETPAINGQENANSVNNNNSNEEGRTSLFWPSNQKKKINFATPQETNGQDDSNNNNNIGEEDYIFHECDYYDEVFDSIVKIYATHNFEPDTTMPWQKEHSYTSSSSGFVIDGRQILTNAHSVEYAGQVLVRRRGSSKKYRAKIEILANECDLAVLSIEDESFWTTRTDYDDGEEDEDDDENDDNGVANGGQPNAENGDGTEDAILPLEFGELPELQDEVEVLGYPTGGDSLSVTKGVVSRIEATEYAQCSGSHLLAIQIDAAINGGNSGGPVVDAQTGKVVGVAFQSLEQAENIGYVVPVTVVLHFLEDIRRHGRYSGVTCLGIRFARLENESMRSYLKLPKETASKKGNKRPSAAKGGVMVRSCFPTCPSKDVLRENDVILSIDGIPVASDGNVPFRRNGRERVSFASYVQTKFADETVQLDLWRDGGPHQVQVPLAISRDKVPAHWDNQAPPYLIVGGLVFSALSVPYLEDCGAWGEYVSDSLSYLVNKVHEPMEHEDDQVVILINVLAHPKNTGYDGLTNLHLVSCNGTKVRSLQHLQDLLQKEEAKGDDEREEYLRFEFGSASSSGGGGTLVVLETNSLQEIDKEVCEEHAIQNLSYFPPSSLP